MCRVPEECPQEIANLIQQCKAVDPKQRPSARDVFEVLKRNCLIKRYVTCLPCTHTNLTLHQNHN